MLKREFLKEQKLKTNEHRQAAGQAISGRQTNPGRLNNRKGQAKGAGLPVYCGIAMIIVSIALMLTFFDSPFLGTLTIGVFAGAASVFLGLLLNIAEVRKK